MTDRKTNKAKSPLQCFEELYAKHKDSVFGYAISLSGNQHFAEEICQDIFLKCFRLIRNGQKIENDKLYLLRGVRNVWLNLLERENLRQKSMGKLLENRSQTSSEMPGEVGLSKAENAAYLTNALDKLPAEQREAIALNYLQGLSLDEVSALLETPKTTVSSRIQRGLQKLEELLPEDFFHDTE